MKIKNNFNKPTLSVGIAAYNEENSIERVISAVLNQKSKNFIFENLILISDGSNDTTVEKVRSIKNNKIKLTAFKKRRGKSKRLNDLCKLSGSEILVLLDADIHIYDMNLIEKIVDTIQKLDNPGGVSGAISPLPATNFTQRVILAGTHMWDEVRKKNKNNELYYSTGAIRALTKKVYKKINFPDIYADDVYPYLFCKSNGMDFAITKNAKVYYKLPESYKDFFKQMRRYQTSRSESSRHFRNPVIEYSYSINVINKLKGFLSCFLKNPFYSSMYILFLLPVYVSMLFEKEKTKKSFWDIATSTKG